MLFIQIIYFYIQNLLFFSIWSVLPKPTLRHRGKSGNAVNLARQIQKTLKLKPKSTPYANETCQKDVSHRFLKLDSLNTTILLNFWLLNISWHYLSDLEWLFFSKTQISKPIHWLNFVKDTKLGQALRKFGLTSLVCQQWSCVWIH